MVNGKKIRILVILFNLKVANGVSSFIMNYFRKLDHNTMTMDFVVYQDAESPYYEEIRKQGSHIYIIPSIKRFKDHMTACQKIIAEGKYDIIHDNILILSTGLMYYAQKMGIPVRILHSHNSELGATSWKKIRNRLFLPLLVRQATDYFACSDLAADCMFGKKEYTFIPNVVDGTKLQFKQKIRDAVRQNFDASNKIVLITVGRLAEQKNPFYAIDVVNELKKNNKDIEYWWVGDGPLENKIKEYIKATHAGSYIHLLGRRTDVSELYQGADVFFLPSFYEGLPVTGVEAQATGLPCFVSDTITQQFIYTDLVKTFSLKNSPEDTAKILAQWLVTIHLNKDRVKYSSILDKSLFSNQNSGKFLEAAYVKLLKNHQNKSKE